MSLVFKQYKAHIAASCTRAIDSVLPPRCIVSGEIVDEIGMISPQVWGKLNFISSPQCALCGVPFGYDNDISDESENMHCTSCLSKKPPYNKARAAVIYDDASRNLILKFKHADQIHAVHCFTPWLVRAGAEILPQTDLLVPVPLHPFRLLRRRYNQAALIAKALSKQTRIPCCIEALRRKRHTPSQGHLSFDERRKNVRHVFDIHPKKSDLIKDKSVTLIDDVYTTGVTVRECARTLLKAGAASVDVLTVARVVKSDYI